MADRRYKLINGGLTATEKSDIESTDLDLTGSVTLGGEEIRLNKLDLNTNTNSSRTVAASDQGQLIEVDSTAVVTLNIPASLGWTDGGFCDIVSLKNTTSVTIAPASGVRVRWRLAGVTGDITGPTTTINRTFVKGMLWRLVKRQGFSDQYYLMELTA